MSISAYSKDTDDRKRAYTLTGHTERSGIEVLFSILSSLAFRSGSIIIIINTQLYAFSGRGQLLCVTNLGDKELYVWGYRPYHPARLCEVGMKRSHR